MLPSATMNKNPASPAVNIQPNLSGNPCATVQKQASKLFFLDLPQPNSPPAAPISPAPERWGEGRACPEDVPLTGFLPRAAGGESALPASPRVPTFPASDTAADRDRAFWGSAEARAAHLPARLPERRSPLRRRGRGVTGDARRTPELHRAASPPPPLRRRQTAPPG